MPNPIPKIAVSASSCINQHQFPVDTYFKAGARYWEEIYAKKDVYSVIHQQRQSLVLAMVDKLGLARDDQILGCGAGLTTAALASRGYRVDAVDSVVEMVDLTRRHAAQEKLRAIRNLARSSGMQNSLPIFAEFECERNTLPKRMFSEVKHDKRMPWCSVPGPYQARSG